MAIYYVSNGQTSSGLTIGSDDVLSIQSGGRIISSTVLSGGLEGINYGGISSDGIVESGGTLQVEPLYITSKLVVGPVTSATVLSGVTVESGGVIDLLGGTVLSGGTVSVRSGGTVDALRISAGGILLGGPAESGFGPGNIQGVMADYGLVSGGTLRAFKAVDPYYPSDGKIAYTASLYVGSGGVAEGVAVQSGALLVVDSSGTASGALVQRYGIEEVVSGGVGSGDIVQSGGKLTVSSAGVENGAAAQADGAVYVSSGGVASGTTVQSGGAETVYSGGVTSAAVLFGGKQDVEAGGRADGARLSGGVEYVFSGGVASAATILAGGQQIVRSGGVASGTTVSGGGVAFLQAGAVESGTVVVSGGADVVSSATASGTVVGLGGREDVDVDGVANGTTVLGGGMTYVFSGGVTSDATISSGGKATISSGGTASDLSVLSGGQLTDEGAVTVSGAGALDGVLLGSGSIAETGGGDLVLGGDGSKFAGTAVVSGGVVELAASKALGSGSVRFVEPSTGSAVLQIDAADMPAAGATFANVISDFSSAGEDIDLTGLAYVSGATATLSGSTLVLHDGGKTDAFTLAGSTAAAYPVLSDGHGGALIDPIPLTQAMAAFTPGSASTVAPVASSPHEPENQLLQATTLLLKTRS